MIGFLYRVQHSQAILVIVQCSSLDLHFLNNFNCYKYKLSQIVSCETQELGHYINLLLDHRMRFSPPMNRIMLTSCVRETKHPSNHKRIVQHLCNILPESKTLAQHCTMLYKMSCFYWGSAHICLSTALSKGPWHKSHTPRHAPRLAE